MGLVSDVVGRKCRRSAERWEEAVSPKSSQFFQHSSPATKPSLSCSFFLFQQDPFSGTEITPNRYFNFMEFLVSTSKLCNVSK